MNPKPTGIGQNKNETNQQQEFLHKLKPEQQQFVLRFCKQLASVIQACEQSESAEIEIGCRRSGDQQVRIKLQAEREN